MNEGLADITASSRSLPALTQCQGKMFTAKPDDSALIANYVVRF